MIKDFLIALGLPAVGGVVASLWLLSFRQELGTLESDDERHARTKTTLKSMVYCIGLFLAGVVLMLSVSPTEPLTFPDVARGVVGIALVFTSIVVYLIWGFVHRLVGILHMFLKLGEQNTNVGSTLSDEWYATIKSLHDGLRPLGATFKVNGMTVEEWDLDRRRRQRELKRK